MFQLDTRLSLAHVILNGKPHSGFYNCSSKTEQEWFDSGESHIFLGLYFVITGILLQLLYVPCLVVMANHEMIRNSCFKIMFLMGVIDIVSMFVNSVATGYLAIVGAVFCTHPMLITVLGAVGCGCWCINCYLCALLALNRCYVLGEVDFLRIFFLNKSVYLLFFSFIIYLFFMIFFTTPPVFNSNFVSWFFDPMTGQNPSLYRNDFHSFNSSTVSVWITLLYVFICIHLYVKNRADSRSMDKIQRQVFLQSFLICVVNVITAYIYVFMQYVTISKIIILLGSVTWQLSSGSAPVIYLIFNRTIRRGVLRMLGYMTVSRVWNLSYSARIMPSS